MAFMGTAQRLFSAVVLPAALTLAACGTQQTEDPPPAVSAPSSAPAAPAVRSVIDPRWMSVGAASRNWKLLSRHIARDKQVMNLQPPGETFTFPNECLGCNHPEATAVVTVYEQGAYDPAAVYTGREVTVNGGEGYYLEPRWPAGAVLAWRHDENAWVTAQGRSQTAAELDTLQELAAWVRPGERTPVRFPVSLPALPADMPLSWAGSQLRIDETALLFDGCRQGPFQRSGACSDGSDSLSMRLERANEFSSHKVTGGGRQEVYTIPVQIGGKEGFIHEDNSTEAAIKAAPGVIVVLEYTGTADRFSDVLENVVWAPDPGNETTWPAVVDWVKQQ